VTVIPYAPVPIAGRPPKKCPDDSIAVAKSSGSLLKTQYAPVGTIVLQFCIS
jgi:hypothetical protein